MGRAALALTLTIAVFASCSDDAPTSGDGTTNNGANNGTANNGATNDGATNDGATNNGATNNGATNNGTPACELSEPEAAPGLVPTAEGWVQGHEASTGWAWLGVPYVAPPVGDLRFRAPEPAVCRAEVLEAAAFGPRCPQLELVQGRRSVVGDEDCLRLNVWSPVAGDDGNPRPVMVFIHGGGNIVGSASEALATTAFLYDGAHLSERGDVVVVTFNYRLGPLGFLALRDLSLDSPDGSFGNYGTRDQIAALRWVRDNIAAFGGDPEQVMIFGESAGAVNTCTMLTSPLAAGLFHAALMQSGFCTTLAAEDGFAVQDAVVEATGCDAGDLVACLRGMDAAALVEAIPGSVGLGVVATGGDAIKYGPVVDGVVMVAPAMDRIATGSHADVPVVLGTNADEMASQAINQVQIDDAADYEQTVRFWLLPVIGADGVEQVLAEYPADSEPTPDDTFVQLATDIIFTCPARTLARHLVAHQRSPVYRYFYTRRPELPRQEGRAAHGIELLYVFGTIHDIRGFRPVEADVQVSDAMMDLWLGLARTGEPGHEGLPAWPPYEAVGDVTLQIDVPVVAVEGVRTDRCDLWDELLP